MKINKSQLARELEVDRRTVDKLSLFTHRRFISDGDLIRIGRSAHSFHFLKHRIYSFRFLMTHLKHLVAFRMKLLLIT